VAVAAQADLDVGLASLDTMITSLAELLEDKGIITQEEWEQKIKKNLES
jgi:hypothetical protein